MMNITDALAIATTKFKTRKLRNAFAAFTVSLGMIIILTFLFGAGGALDFGKKIFVDSLSERHFTLTSFSIGYIETDEFGKPIIEGAESPKLPAYAADATAWKNEHANAGITNVFLQRRFGGVNGGGFGLNTEGETIELGGGPQRSLETYGFPMFATDPLLVQDFVYKGYSLDAPIDGAVPILLPKHILLDDYFLGDSAEAQKKIYEESEKRAAKFVGTKFTLTRVTYGPEREEAEATDVQMIVVGFISDTFFSTPLYEAYGITVPNWAETYSPALAQLFGQYEEWRVLSEFDSQDARDAFVKSQEEKYGYGQFGFSSQIAEVEEQTVMPFTNPAPTRFEAFAEIVKFFRSVAFGIGGFFVAISAIFIMTTLGKIIADSQKEIGIFRAVGAQKRDVKKIYFGYAWLLVTGGFVIGFVIAVILSVIASWKWGEAVFYQMMNAAVQTEVQQPLFLFLHINPLYLLGLYCAMLLVGLLASLLPIRRASRVDPISVLKDI